MAYSNPCSICMEGIDNVHMILRCDHKFHLECIHTWVKEHECHTCPMCRDIVSRSIRRMMDFRYSTEILHIDAELEESLNISDVIISVARDIPRRALRYRITGTTPRRQLFTADD